MTVNIIHQEWSGVSVNEHKGMKGLESQNLRDHMSEAELIFTALAELSTRQISENVDAYRYAAKPNRRQGRWPHRPPGAQSAGKPDREVGGL